MADESGQEGGGKYRRKGAERLVQGAGCYVDDVRLPNALYAAFVRSSAARARIKSLDLSAARSCRGVVAVLAWPDIMNDMRPLSGPEGPLAAMLISPLARSLVHYVGEPLAVAVAESRYQAQDGADAVNVDYDLLPAIIDPEA
ncbi:MAG TPA: hypothetical protein VE131_07765, partial [Terriglobales bacterium]|nr:hypothetical protein [Terriglobales bacterium]